MGKPISYDQCVRLVIDNENSPLCAYLAQLLECFAFKDASRRIVGIIEEHRNAPDACPASAFVDVKSD